MLKNSIDFFKIKKCLLRFQKILKSSDFLVSEVKILETAHFNNLVHTKKTQISEFLSRLHQFLFYPQKYFFDRNIRYFYVLGFNNNF